MFSAHFCRWHGRCGMGCANISRHSSTTPSLKTRMETDLWQKCLSLSPWRSKRFRSWDDLKGKNWAALLRERPEFSAVCAWSKLSGSDWAELLAKRPQFAEHCNKWGEMDGADWAWLLLKQPRFADRSDWSKLKGNNWSRLLFRLRCSPTGKRKATFGRE